MTDPGFGKEISADEGTAPAPEFGAIEAKEKEAFAEMEKWKTAVDEVMRQIQNVPPKVKNREVTLERLAGILHEMDQRFSVAEQEWHEAVQEWNKAASASVQAEHREQQE